MGGTFTIRVKGESVFTKYDREVLEWDLHDVAVTPRDLENRIIGTLARFLEKYWPKCPFCDRAVTTPIPREPYAFKLCCSCSMRLKSYESQFPDEVREPYDTCGECEYFSNGRHMSSPLFNIKIGKCKKGFRQACNASTPGCPINTGDQQIKPKKGWIRMRGELLEG